MTTCRYKTTSLILSAALAASLCACSSGGPESLSTNPTVTETASTSTETTAESSSADFITEPSTSASLADTDFVRIVDGVSPEMMNPDFWISEDDNELLMTSDEIAQFNYANRVHQKTGDGVQMPYFDECEDTLDGNILRAFLNENASMAPKDPSKYYLNGNKTTKEYWDDLIKLSNIEGIPDEIEVRFGFTVKRMTLRLFPTEDRVFEDSSDELFDYMLYAECMPYMPVLILHESLDGEYLYVVFDSYASWVRKDAVAMCKDRDDWNDRQNPEHWLTVTGRELRLGDDPYVEAVRDLVLPMGTRMELILSSEAPSSISNRSTYGNYIVKVPTRGTDGFIKDEYVLIPISDDATIGYLPLTSANIVRQAFKLLGDRYGWGGDLRANDCTGITREIYRCFGVLLPRVGQSGSTGVYKVDMSDMSSEEKLEVIKDLAPGSLISMPGHMTIYLGTVDGIPYVISATGSFSVPAPGPTETIHANTVIVTSIYVRLSSQKTWLDAMKTALTLKKAE
ncbi:MAG: SH3 domain-containing protein [Clostridiales bacterium]|nr:SH3 domain-containing protein [Clostridiales bacterium]